jgi:hypothetical protein
MLAILAVLLVASLQAPEGQGVPWVVLGIILATALLLTLPGDPPVYDALRER